VFSWRSHDGLKVDLLARVGGRLTPIEVKLTATPLPRHVDALQRFKVLAGAEASDRGLLVCRVPAPVELPHGNLAIPWRDFPAWLRDALDPGPR